MDKETEDKLSDLKRSVVSSRQMLQSKTNFKINPVKEFDLVE
jgi:hypothetical protein